MSALTDKACIEKGVEMRAAQRRYYGDPTEKNRMVAAVLEREFDRLSLTAQLAKCREATVEEWLDCHKLDTPERVFFYEQDFYVLSNFSAFKVQWHHLVFDTSEAAYHWTRFATGFEFGDADAIEADKIADMILECRSAHDAFKLAQEHKCRQRPDWDLAKVGIMRRILRAKADQHEYVRRKLLATGDRELIEDSRRDDFWGRGPNRGGQNMLGKLWMEVRAEYRALTTGEPK